MRSKHRAAAAADAQPKHLTADAHLLNDPNASSLSLSNSLSDTASLPEATAIHSNPSKPRRPILSSISSRARSVRSSSNLRLNRIRSRMSSQVSVLDPVSAPTSAPGTPSIEQEEEDYVNPLEAGPRWMLTTRAVAVRTAASIGSSVFGWFYQPTRVIWFDACKLLSRKEGPLSTAKIQVDIWEPGPTAGVDSKAQEDASPRRLRPAVINFHGGGFFLGIGTDDAWWATTASQELGAVVFSVSYRLAPGHPFPIPVEDCADAILQIAARADEFGIDPNKISLSGFSAGGNLCLGSWVILQQPEHWGYVIPSDVSVPKLAGMAVFYPGLDHTISRPRKRASCSQPDLTLPKFLTDIIDASYVYPALPPEQRSDPRLSPGLMDEALVERLPQIHLCLCEHDMLTAEGKRFGARLRAKGKLADLRVVPDERHAWDKPPPMSLKNSAHTEYHAAIASLGRAMGVEVKEVNSKSVETDGVKDTEAEAKMGVNDEGPEVVVVTKADEDKTGGKTT
jgi:acetyl esterase/lipase